MVFQPGQSGNPQGLPSKARKEFKQRLISEGLVDRAIEVLKEELSDKRKNRADIAKYLLDQVYGKPSQFVEHTGQDGEAMVINFIAPKEGLCQ